MSSGRDVYAAKYSADADRQAEWLASMARPKADSVIELTAGLPRTSIIDLGGGPGAVLSEIQRRSVGERHYLVDYSADAIAEATRRNPTLRAAQADLTVNPDPFGEGPYDVAFTSHVIEHLETPLEFLRALHHVPFRWLVAEVPLDDLLASRVKNVVRDRTRNTAGHVQFFTRRSFLSLLDEAGFEVAGSRSYAPVLTADAYRLAAEGQPRARRALMRMTQQALPRALGPLWTRCYHAHFAVLCRPRAS